MRLGWIYATGATLPLPRAEGTDLDSCTVGCCGGAVSAVRFDFSGSYLAAGGSELRYAAACPLLLRQSVCGTHALQHCQCALGHSCACTLRQGIRDLFILALLFPGVNTQGVPSGVGAAGVAPHQGIP